jgi:hypothetical protein
MIHGQGVISGRKPTGRDQFDGTVVVDVGYER